MTALLHADPVVVVLTGVVVGVLVVLMLQWGTRRQLVALRRELVRKVNETADYVEDLDGTVASLADILDSHDALLRRKPEPVAIPVSVSQSPLPGWIDAATGPQPIPDPPTALIPRVTARETAGSKTRHTPSEPKTAALSLRDLMARLEAEQGREAQ